MNEGKDGSNTHRQTQAEEVSSLRARDVRHVSGAGVDVPVAEEVPSTGVEALHGHVKVIQRERFHTLRWYLIFIIAVVVIAVILGIQLF